MSDLGGGSGESNFTTNANGDLTPKNGEDVDVPGQKVSTENMVEARGPSGNALETYDVGDYADLGDAINQAIADGAAEIVGPPVDQSFATQVHVPNTFSLTFRFPNANYTYNGSSDPFLFETGDHRFLGGRWAFDGADGGANNLAFIKLASTNGNTVNGCEMHPGQIANFHKGFHLQTGGGGGINYNEIGARDINSCVHGVYVELADANNTSQANLFSGWRVDGGTATDPSAFTLDTASQVCTGWNWLASVENTARVFNFPGANTVAGQSAKLYMENEGTRVNDPNNVADEVYIERLWNRHSMMEVHINTRSLTNLATIRDASVTAVARFYDDGSPRFGWEVAGNEVFAVQQDRVNSYDHPVHRPGPLQSGSQGVPPDPGNDRWNLYASDGSDAYGARDLVYEETDGSGNTREARVVADGHLASPYGYEDPNSPWTASGTTSITASLAGNYDVVRFRVSAIDTSGNGDNPFARFNGVSTSDYNVRRSDGSRTTGNTQISNAIAMKPNLESIGEMTVGLRQGKICLTNHLIGDASGTAQYAALSDISVPPFDSIIFDRGQSTDWEVQAFGTDV
jgi:hypothetical protein